MEWEKGAEESHWRPELLQARCRRCCRRGRADPSRSVRGLQALSCGLVRRGMRRWPGADGEGREPCPAGLCWWLCPAVRTSAPLSLGYFIPGCFSLNLSYICPSFKLSLIVPFRVSHLLLDWMDLRSWRPSRGSHGA